MTASQMDLEARYVAFLLRMICLLLPRILSKLVSFLLHRPHAQSIYGDKFEDENFELTVSF